MQLSNRFQDTKLYYVKNKNNTLLTFVWIGGLSNESQNLSIDSVYAMNVPNYIITDIYRWLQSRTPPKHREYMQELLDTIGANTTRSVIDFSKGLSLTDTFWVTSNPDLKWEDINLFDNEFDETISRIAFDGGLYGKNFKTTSPELATDGMLPKCWVRENGVIRMKKGGTSLGANSGNEPYSEVMATQILDRLNYNHVRYKLENFRGKLVSSCDIITDQNTMMLPIYFISPVTTIDTVIDFCKGNSLLDDLHRMLIFDYLSLNSDRHLGNIGLLLDANTFEVLKLAPIYDNGASLLCYYMLGDDLENYTKNYRPALYDSYETYAKIAKQHLPNNHNVEALINFKFDQTELGDFPAERISVIEEFVQTRVKQFLSW